MDIIQAAKQALQIEKNAIDGLIDRLDGHEATQFSRACELLLQCKGRIIVSGVGKSGHIANKIAATLASTGSPAFFVHPAEASHGDLGMVMTNDVMIALSNSGKTDELLFVLPLVKRLGVPLIAMTGDTTSPLAQLADVHLNVGVKQEACPHNLAPTASTTATLAMGDALAVVVLQMRGFTAEDFARSHPGGALGRRLLVYVQQVMRQSTPAQPLPLVTPDTCLHEVMLTMTSGRMGFAIVVDEHNRLQGVFTDGDLRRTLEQIQDWQQLPVKEVMTRHPHVIGENALAIQAFEVMERHRVTQLVVTNASGQVVGALNMHDLFQAKIV